MATSLPAISFWQPKMTMTRTRTTSREEKKSSGGGRMVRKKISSRCYVIGPPKNKKVKGIIKLLGGAFIGAVPDVTYRYLTELLAMEGYLVVSVPYDVTFDHQSAAIHVYETFNSCFDSILAKGFPNSDLAPQDVAHLPLFSVAHSNGALLQLLIASYFSTRLPKANVIVSFNNKSAIEAVPFFEQFGPLLNQTMPILEASPLYALVATFSGDARKMLVNTLLLNNNKEAVRSFNQFVDQLPSILYQVRQGLSEFRPPPSENRECFKKSYNVQHTLLVKFISDTIDETDLLEDVLRPRVDSLGGTLEKVELSGNHVTPCLQEPKWQAGYSYTPADAIAQRLKTISLNETRLLSRTITDWLKTIQHSTDSNIIIPS